MAGRFLLDTNVVTAFFRPEAAVEIAARGQQVYLSSTILGELYYGANKGARRSENTVRIDQFAAASRVLPCDHRTARVYEEIKMQLRTKGTPIPDNDLWIAAIALQHDLTLVTRDKHFDTVESIRLASW